jgi:hypothetical protein
MKRPVNDTERGWLGLDAPISRRDFVNGSLAVAGSALAPPAGAAIADTFTGYGGVGDYARANGNTTRGRGSEDFVGRSQDPTIPRTDVPPASVTRLAA